MSEKALIKQFIISEIVVDQKYSNLDDNDPLLETGIIDSLGIQKIIAFLEDKFNITLTDEDIVPDNFLNVEAIASFISSKK